MNSWQFLQVPGKLISIVSLGLATLAPGGLAMAQAGDRMGNNILARSFAETPPALQEPFEAAIVAWKDFSVQDESLRKAFDEEIARISGRGRQRRYESDFQALGSDSLHRYLYPWVDASAVLSRPHRPLPDIGTANGDAVERSRRRLKELVAKVKDLKSSNLAPTFLQALESWRNYRDAACHLTAVYRQIELADKNGQGNRTAPDAECLEAFNRQLTASAEELLEQVRKEYAALTADLPSIDSRGAKLHYLYNYGSSSNHEKVRQVVKITDTSAPLIVILESYEPTEWNIHVGKGVQIRQLLLFGFYRQTFQIYGATPNVGIYSVEEGNYAKVQSYLSKGSESRLDLRDALTEMLGLPPTTMQFELPDGIGNVDGKRSWTYVSRSGQRGKVVWTANGQSIASGNRVTSSDRGIDMVFASEGRRKGKWYFEVATEPIAPEYIDWAGGTVGVIDPSRNSPWSDLLYKNSVTSGSSRKINPGATVNVALDLENGVVYYGIDGKWLVGDPSESQGGMPLKKGRDYIPAMKFYSRSNVAYEKKVEASKISHGTWIGRFSAKDFGFTPPPGYQPYEQRQP